MKRLILIVCAAFALVGCNNKNQGGGTTAKSQAVAAVSAPE